MDLDLNKKKFPRRVVQLQNRPPARLQHSPPPWKVLRPQLTWCSPSWRRISGNPSSQHFWDSTEERTYSRGHKSWLGRIFNPNLRFHRKAE